MVKPDFTIGHMPGKIAQRYEELGGKVISFGKPYKEHFEACLRDLGLPKDRVAHVGDSLHHDIAGANDTGIASVFAAGGIHHEELGAPLGTLPDRSN
jgi:ribonucleotide monophosphatase NagD (HAD superfamily)